MTGNRQEKERNITDLLNYIRYNNFEVTDSKIYSIFDYLYGQFSAARKSYLQKHKRISEYDSENLMSALLEEILGAEKYSALAAVDHYPLNLLVKDRQSFSPREREYFMNPLTHVDFVIFNRITKKALLAIEVDGYAYHQAGSRQAERDAMKNDILRACDIPLLRFKRTAARKEPPSAPNWTSCLAPRDLDTKQSALKPASCLRVGRHALPGLADSRDNPDRRTNFFSQHRQKQPWQKTADKVFFFRGLKICLHEQFFRSEHLFTAKSVLNAAKFALKRTLLPGKNRLQIFRQRDFVLEERSGEAERKKPCPLFSRRQDFSTFKKKGQKNGQKKRRAIIFLAVPRDI